ncbi:MAG: hypothetical protein J6B04_01245, partial [Clostridia bacterium]|nr:hypothetical protein [Clostridia bacterium]
REQNGIKKVIYDGIYKEKIYDTPKNGTYVYSVIPYYEYKDKKYFGKEYFFPAVNVGNNKYSPPQIKVPNLIYGDWFNE